jgi:cytochrome P450
MFVKNAISGAIAAIGTRRSFDLVDDFARPVPRDVYFDILGGSGISAAERLVLDELARTMMKFHDRTMDFPEQLDGLVATLKLLERLQTMLLHAASPGSPYQGTFLGYLAGKVDWFGGPFTPLIASLTLVNLTVAGYMSVEFLMATGIRRLLLDRRAGWTIVKADLSTLPDFLREMRRTEHALSVVERYAKKDIVMNGVSIARGALVLGVLASANRDHAFFGPDADEFKPGRPNAHQHLGLGYGTHACMGRALENLISEPAIGGLATAMPGLRLQSAAQPPWFENFYFRSFDHLAVTLN